MTRRTAAGIGAALLAALDLAVIMAPSVVLAAEAHKGGLPATHGLDLLAVSTVVGLLHAKVVWDRLRDEVSHAGRLIDVWIAAFDSLVVLALGATLLLLLILGGFAEEHATLLNEGWPVLYLWLGVELLAVGLAELSGRAVFHWLEPTVEPDVETPESAREAEAPAPPTVGSVR